MKIHLNAILLFLALAFPYRSGAQATGSFDTTIAFTGGTRQLSLYVPAGYNPANKYRLMVCLHGLGDTCTNYRSALINSLGWGSAFPNTIFVCPEAANKSMDYYTPAGGEAIIPASVSFVMSRYHIDTQNVVLQGFSLGGRAALRYGLDHYNVFKGLLLTTAAVQGVKEAVNGHPATYSFNYANASRIPIYMTVGGNDIAYISPLDSTYEHLVLNDGIVRYQIIPGLGHSIPTTSQMADFLPFLDSPGHAGKDAEAVMIYPPNWVCNSSQATAALLIRNSGRDTITSVKLSYTLSGLTQKTSWVGNLSPFQHVLVPINLSNVVPGSNTLSVRIDSLNQVLPDTVLGNNQLALTFDMPVTPLSGILEGFEGSVFPPAGWTLQKSGDFYTGWEVDNTIAKTGNQSASAFNTIFYFDNASRGDGMTAPPVNISGLTSPRLSFDVSYLYHRYTPPYFLSNVDFADTLEVFVSNDCGAHFTRVFKKGGEQLATFSSPIINPLTFNDLFRTPADSEWRREVIDLSGYQSGANPVFIRFNYVSALGGAINIDNVFVGSATGTASNTASDKQRIYPNPARDKITVSSTINDLQQISLTDLSGKALAGKAANNMANELSLDVQALPAGVYMLTIRSADGIRTEKLTIVR